MSLKNIDPSFYYKKSRIQQLKGFCYTVQLGSAIKASQKMSLGNNTVSMQIKSLERDLETKLFDRKNGRLIPNKDGELFYKLAIPIVQSVDGLFERFLIGSKKIKEEKIKISAHHIALSHILPQYIKQFLDIYPEAKFVLNNIPKKEGYEQLINGEVDMAIYPIELNTQIPEEIKCIEAFKYESVLIMHKNHPLAKKPEKEILKEDILKYNFVHMDKKMITATSWISIFAESNIEMTNGSWEIAKAMVKRNIGISGMSKLYIREDEKEIVTKSIAHLMPDLIHCIFLKKNGFISKSSEKFLGLLNHSPDFIKNSSNNFF